MKKIGFKNFRKFEEFPSINLGEITILVGANNSGKSTLVKAILLILDFLKAIKSGGLNLFEKPVFRFDKNEFHDVRIGTFQRALCNSQEASDIAFTLTLDKFLFEIVVKGDKEDKNANTAAVSIIRITDIKRNIVMLFDFMSAHMIIEFPADSDQVIKDDSINQIKNEIKRLKKAQVNTIELADVLRIKSEINSLTKKLGPTKNKNIDKGAKVEVELSTFINSVEENCILQLVNGFVKYANQPSIYMDKRSKEYKNDIKKKECLQDKNETIKELLNELLSTIDGNNIEYVYAHAASQVILYNTKDENDYLAKTLHDFARLRIIKGEKEYDFIGRWMKIFDIGIDFEIESIAGEAYTLKVIDERKNRVYLADKGMGSIQLMILLLRIATIMRQYKGRKKTPTIIIEEPEQNLHPALQSKLADLFYEINRDFGVRFIIETHSEYLVRRTQVIVASEKIFSDSPFTVYYFNKETAPYQLKYLENGRFDEKFGEGFFDEAGKWNIELIKIERGI